MPDPDQFVPLSKARLPLFVGIDLGGTNTKLGLVDELGRTLAYHSVATDAHHGPEDAVARMAEGVDYLVKQAGAQKKDLARVGLATPGPMDIPSGMLLTPGNLPDWWNFPIRDRVSQACTLPVRFANDANAAAYGEYWQGAGIECQSMVMITLGTGVGGGIVIGDLLVEGAHSCGGECGHILIDPSDDAPRDSLEKTGSLEAYCGSYGVVGRAVAALEAGRKSLLAEMHARGEEITPLDIAEAADRGDQLARQVVLDTAHYLALGIVNFVHTIDPEYVVLGGGMTFGGAGSPLGEEFLQKIRDVARHRLLPPLRPTLRVEFARLGGDAGYLGAAGLARLEHQRVQ
jgi:glucokinase